MAKFTMTTGAKRHDLVYQLDFMGRSYPVRFEPTEDGMTSRENSIFIRVPGYDDLPEKVRKALQTLSLAGTVCDINEAVQTLTRYEQEQRSKRGGSFENRVCHKMKQERRRRHG